MRSIGRWIAAVSVVFLALCWDAFEPLFAHEAILELGLPCLVLAFGSARLVHRWAKRQSRFEINWESFALPLIAIFSVSLGLLISMNGLFDSSAENELVSTASKPALRSLTKGINSVAIRVPSSEGGTVTEVAMSGEDFEKMYMGKTRLSLTLKSGLFGIRWVKSYELQ